MKANNVFRNFMILYTILAVYVSVLIFLNSAHLWK